MINRVMSTIWTEFRTLQPGVQVEAGKKELDVNSTTTRIVWFPVRDRFTDTAHPGRNPKQVKSMSSDIEIHIYAKTMDEIDDIKNDVIVAMTRVIYNPSILDLRGDYEDPGSDLQDGFGYVLLATLDLVIWERPLRTVKIQTIADPVTNTIIDYNIDNNIP